MNIFNTFNTGLSITDAIENASNFSPGQLADANLTEQSAAVVGGIASTYGGPLVNAATVNVSINALMFQIAQCVQDTKTNEKPSVSDVLGVIGDIALIGGQLAGASGNVPLILLSHKASVHA